MSKTLEEKIDDLAASVKVGFDAADKRVDVLGTQMQIIVTRVDTLSAKVENLPDKAYLDEKLADLKGDLVVKLRREDAKMEFLIDLLRDRNVLTIVDVQRLKQEFEIFPRLH